MFRQYFAVLLCFGFAMGAANAHDHRSYKYVLYDVYNEDEMSVVPRLLYENIKPMEQDQELFDFTKHGACIIKNRQYLVKITGTVSYRISYAKLGLLLKNEITKARINSFRIYVCTHAMFKTIDRLLKARMISKHVYQEIDLNSQMHYEEYMDFDEARFYCSVKLNVEVEKPTVLDAVASVLPGKSKHDSGSDKNLEGVIERKDIYSMIWSTEESLRISLMSLVFTELFGMVYTRLGVNSPKYMNLELQETNMTAQYKNASALLVQLKAEYKNKKRDAADREDTAVEQEPITVQEIMEEDIEEPTTTGEAGGRRNILYRMWQRVRRNT